MSSLSPSASPSASPSLSLALSLLLFSCTSPCPRGPTTTCWCPGDAVGQATCGEDGRYGACVCPGSTGLTPEPVVPTPQAPPPPLPPLGPMVPTPIPPGIDPPPLSAVTPDRDATIAAWIAGPLRGHDNRSAAMRSVSITSAGAGYQIFVQNQFGFRCELELDAAGNPSAMRACDSRDPDWSAQPDLIAVTCENRGTEVHCEAPYHLRTQGGYHSRETFVFSRRASRPSADPSRLRRPPPTRPLPTLDPWASRPPD